MEEGQHLAEAGQKYESYIEFKGWHSLFETSVAERLSYEHLFRELSLKEKAILDIGFGSGSLLAWYRTQHGSCSGIEIQPDLVEAARELGFDAHFELVGVRGRHFDLISALDVMEHLSPSEITRVLEDVRRLCSEDSLVVIRVPNCQSAAGLITQFGDATHKTMLSLPIILQFAKVAGFRLLKFEEAIPISTYERAGIRSMFLEGLRSLIKKVMAFGFGAANLPLAADIVVWLAVDQNRSI